MYVSMYTCVCGSQRCWTPLETELPFVSHLMWILGIELWSSIGKIHAPNCWASQRQVFVTVWPWAYCIPLQILTNPLHTAVSRKLPTYCLIRQIKEVKSLAAGLWWPDYRTVEKKGETTNWFNTLTVVTFSQFKSLGDGNSPAIPQGKLVF